MSLDEDALVFLVASLAVSLVDLVLSSILVDFDSAFLVDAGGSCREPEKYFVNLLKPLAFFGDSLAT